MRRMCRVVARLTTDTLSKLAEFLVSELGGKITDGVTYTMVQKDDSGKLLLERCKRIRKELTDSGYKDAEIFTIYEVNNGYIFDMAEWLVKKVAADIVKDCTGVAKDYVGNAIQDRRDADGKRLARLLLGEFKSGKDRVSVALFSRNSTPRILVTALDINGKPLGIKYQSFGLRHIDLERVNVEHLIPKGIRIATVEPVEVLPKNTGCRFVLSIERV